MSFTYNISKVCRSNYLSNLEQFYLQCERLKKDAIDPGLLKIPSINDLKVSYTPRIEFAVTEAFDFVVKNSLNLDANQVSPNLTSIMSDDIPVTMLRLGASLIVNSSKSKIIEDIKAATIKIFGMWRNCGLDTFIDDQLENISVQKIGSVADLVPILNNFWMGCAYEWAKNHQMEIYMPSEELKERLIVCGRHYHREKAQCISFLVCFLNIEHELMSSFPMGCACTDALKFFRKVLGYHLVDQAKTGDIIVYLDAKNDPVHFGAFEKNDSVISKFGHLNIYRHSPTSSIYGDSYIILRQAS